jgi:hypothetical protein
MATIESVPMASPPATELEKELSERCEDARGRASALEADAAQWRAVEHALMAALESLKRGAG